MKKIYLLIILLLVTASFLGLFNISLSSRLASDSVKVKKLQTNIDKLEEKNQILKSEVLEITSFEVLASRAAELGFVDATKYISLHKDSKLSLRNE